MDKKSRKGKWQVILVRVVEPVAAEGEASVAAVVAAEAASAWDPVEIVYVPVVEQRFPTNPVHLVRA